MKEASTILLIDDSQAIRELVRTFCAGHLDVAAVGSESEALEVLKKETFDLILLDIELMGSDGFAVMKSLQENMKREGLPEPPVLALSAHDGSEFISKLIEAGFAGRVKKPFQKKYLLQVLANYLLRD